MCQIPFFSFFLLFLGYSWNSRHSLNKQFKSFPFHGYFVPFIVHRLFGELWLLYSAASFSDLALIHYTVKLPNAVVAPGIQADVIVKGNEEGIDLKKKSPEGRDWGYRR